MIKKPCGITPTLQFTQVAKKAHHLLAFPPNRMSRKHMFLLMLHASDGFNLS